ncbi:MAG: peptide chain release factor 2 [Oscillospiraceae bacterium]|nr:peptide chain release factor 2 [Oscillospiraceae bacterium]MDD4367448.1 peptide chain release factor 2 [Oscillospiraceae bacterium]
MLEYDAYKQDLTRMEAELQDLKAALYIERTEDEASELEARAQEPDFWNDTENAQKVQTQITHMRRKVSRFRALEHQREELLLLIDLANEAEDLGEVEEVSQGTARLRQEIDHLRLETLFTGEYDDHNAILTLHAGEGGTEAMDWAEMLERMYLRWADDHEMEVKVLDELPGETAGLKSCSLLISGENAYGYLKSEMGVHRLVRISPFDSSGRRHTSFASCEILPELDDTIKIEIRPEDIKMDVFRSSGAGGQHVNKTSSAVRLTHIPTGIVVSCQAERSQFQNRDTAMAMLKSRLFALAKSKHLDQIDDLKGDQMSNAWGSQIRSYVFCPYTMVKDHRSGYEESDVAAVMDGHLDGFINAYLTMNVKNELAGADQV